MSATKQCSVDGCGSGVLARGLCSKHYDRQRRLGSTSLPRKTKDDLCIDCQDRNALYKVDGGGICQRCLRRRQRADKPKPEHAVCVHCGQTFTPKRVYREGAGRGLFCSRVCKDKERVADGRAAEATSKSMYKMKYGLTLEQVEIIRARGCGICGGEGGEGRWGNLHIDHDHRTGDVRGGLCHTCNLGLGNFKDDPALLAAALSYVTTPPGPPLV